MRPIVNTAKIRKAAKNAQLSIDVRQNCIVLSKFRFQKKDKEKRRDTSPSFLLKLSIEFYDVIEQNCRFIIKYDLVITKLCSGMCVNAVLSD